MVSNCPRIVIKLPARQDTSGWHPRSSAHPAHGAQIAILHGTIDIDHAANVVVRRRQPFHRRVKLRRHRPEFPARDRAAGVMGMFWRSCRDCISYCGVCATRL